MNTKVIFTGKVSVANALIRQANLRAGGVSSFNTLVKTPRELAKEIVGASKDGDLSYISTDCAVYLMLNVLRGIDPEMFPESAITVATAKDVLKRINEIRDNGVKAEYLADIKTDGKIGTLNRILLSYEKSLDEQDIYDDTKRSARMLPIRLRNIFRIFPGPHTPILKQIYGLSSSMDLYAP